MATCNINRWTHGYTLHLTLTQKAHIFVVFGQER